MFGNRYATPISKAQMMENRYRNARFDLLIIALFTIINLAFLTTENYTYFLFSASIPYALVDFAMVICGRYPEEMYEGGYDTYEFFDPTVFYIIVAIAMVIAMLYILFAVLSRKNRVGWLYYRACILLARHRIFVRILWFCVRDVDGLYFPRDRNCSACNGSRCPL